MIDKGDAFEFLQKNQPLPDDADLESEIQKFNEVLQYFQVNSDPDCIPLLLNCFGEGSGFGLYQIIEDLLKTYNDGLVIKHLKNALFSKYAGVRYWCAQIAENYEADELIDGLINVYNKGDVDSKCSSLIALSYSKDKRVLELAKKTLENEIDEDLIEISLDILN